MVWKRLSALKPKLCYRYKCVVIVAVNGISNLAAIVHYHYREKGITTGTSDCIYEISLIGDVDEDSSHRHPVIILISRRFVVEQMVTDMWNGLCL